MRQRAGIQGKRTAALALAAVIVAADQMTKWFVLERLLRPAAQSDPGADVAHSAGSSGFFAWLADAPPPLDFVRIEVLPFFNWVMVWNKGVSFGLLQSDSPYAPWVMSALALLVSGFFLAWLMKTDRACILVALALVIGGAAGNVIDRVRFGAVADFVDLHVAGMHWPAFNLADACITLGIALILVDGLFFGDIKQRASADPVSSQDGQARHKPARVQDREDFIDS